MKLGLVSAILADLSFEEVVDYAAEKGFQCLEMMCWPVGKGGAKVCRSDPYRCFRHWRGKNQLHQ